MYLIIAQPIKVINFLFYKIEQIVISALYFSHYITTAAENCLLTKG